MSEFKKKAAKGIAWGSIERFSSQGIQFVLDLFLARLLLPSDYGLIGMLAIFIAISQSFIDSGFGTALIQKKNRDNLDFSTSFYFNIVVGVLFYILLYFLSPLIADFYNQPILISLSRVLGLLLIINSFAVVPRTKFTIKLDFKTQTKASFSSTIVSGILGIYLAYTGLGVWALVWQVILRRILETLILWLYSDWLPKEGFSYLRFKKLFSFGYKLLVVGLIDTTYKNIYLIIIGKTFSTSTLGYYTRAQQFNNYPSASITGILQRVTFPILSQLQDDDKRLKDVYRKIIKLSALVIFPLMMGLAALAQPIIQITLTDKWSETVWMLQLLTFAGMWFPVHALNLNILNVKGRSDLFLRLEMIKKVMITLILVISIPLGIKAIIIGQIFSSYFALIINAYYTKRIIDYGFLQQMSDLLKVLFLSFAMGVLIFYTISFINSNILKIITGLVEGVVFYISIAWLFNIGEIKSLPSFIMQK